MDAPVAVKPVLRTLAPGIVVIDDLLPEADRAIIQGFLQSGGWQFGWKSSSKTDIFSFWHKHFAGHRHAKHETQYECDAELEKKFPTLHRFWQQLNRAMFAGDHDLYRCYANAQSYGSDGTLHTDSKSEHSITSVYYPHEKWEPNWAGETLIFNANKTDIVAAVYPRPNRLLAFPGNAPHVARGVSRTCPVLRTTLMFKSEARPYANQGRA
jgi:SM-20-related protein